MTAEELIALGESVKAGHNVTFYEARRAALSPEKKTLYKVADDLRRHFRGDHFQTCSIINARSGRCLAGNAASPPTYPPARQGREAYMRHRRGQ